MDGSRYCRPIPHSATPTRPRPWPPTRRQNASTSDRCALKESERNSTVQTTTAAPLADLIPDSRVGWKQTGTMLALTIIPFVASVALLWNTAVGWTDLGLLVVLYVFCGFGITIGFHRMLTHSAFEAVKPLKGGLLIFGSMAVQGSAITWAVDHRTHHAHS